MARQPRTPQGVPKRKAARKAAPKAAPKRKAPAKGPPKRQRNYAAEYAKRTAGVPKGQRGAARGHKVPPGRTEAQVRREKIERTAEQFVADQAAKMPGTDAADPEAIADVLALIRREGMAGFNRMRDYLAQLHRRYMRQRDRDRRGRRPSLGIDLDELAERWQLPPDFLGYH
jgi:hypothetical protein